MALINCPECTKEISDSVVKCPHCGYTVKKNSKKPLILISVSVAVLALLIVLGYFFIIKPQQAMNEASNLIERGKYSEADVILASVPNSPRKLELLGIINLNEAKQALANGNYMLAEEKLNQVPEGSVTKEILQQINEQKAKAMLGLGQYIEADALYAAQEQTEEVKELRKQLFYESRVLHCALQVKDTLLHPDSMILVEAIVLEGDFTKDELASTPETNTLLANQPTIVLHYQAKSKGGNMSTGYVRFVWKNDAYNMKTSVNSLKTDEKNPSYYDVMSSSEQLEYHLEQLEIAAINFDLILRTWEAQLQDDQLKRVNSALHGTSTKDQPFIPNNELMPLPSPKLEAVTPAPTTTP